MSQVRGAADSTCAPGEVLSGGAPEASGGLRRPAGMKEPRPGCRGALKCLSRRAGSCLWVQMGDGSHGRGCPLPVLIPVWVRQGWEAWVLFLTLCALTSQLKLPLQKKPQLSLITWWATPVGLLELATVRHAQHHPTHRGEQSRRPTSCQTPAQGQHRRAKAHPHPDQQGCFLCNLAPSREPGVQVPPGSITALLSPGPPQLFFAVRSGQERALMFSTRGLKRSQGEEWSSLPPGDSPPLTNYYLGSLSQREGTN